MSQILSQILLSISLLTTGSALRCYHCLPNNADSSCIPEPMTCKNGTNATHCLSMRRRISRNSELTYKACAGDSRCVSAHTVCAQLINSSRVEGEDCHAYCCKGDLCNLHVHINESHNIDTRKAGPKNYSVSSISLPLTALMTSLWLMLLNS